MGENIKNKFILILAVFACILFVISIDSCGKSRAQKLARNKEMIARLDLEEHNQRIQQEKSNIEEKLKNISKTLEEEKAANQAVKNALVQEQLVNQSLKEELQKLNKLKETLEEDIKELLTTNPVREKK